MQSESKWRRLNQAKIAAIEFNASDRWNLLSRIEEFCPRKQIYYCNIAYKYFQTYESANLKETEIETGISPIEMCRYFGHSAIFIFEGYGEISSNLSFQLRNFFYEKQKFNHQIFLVDSYINIPLDIFPLVHTARLAIPLTEEIESILISKGGSKSTKEIKALAHAAFGLFRGEIELLIESNSSRSNLKEEISRYKEDKLESQGLEIAPVPDIGDVGGLDAIEEDIQKIKVLFTPEARKRGLKPPSACLLWGLPGTGKSLISKLMGKKLNAQLVVCNWNKLMDVNLARSLSNLQYMLDVVDNMGNCVLFFDEFEKAYSGWDSGDNGGVLAKMAGILLTWMQDHTSPVIMLATINHLNLLPPELIRRFQYTWFFDSDLHYGAMHEIFELHIAKHFYDLALPLNDSQWLTIFTHYRGCSPSEIALAVSKTHEELFYRGLHQKIDPESLKVALIEERAKFTPAILNKSISDALAKIKRECDFARPVRGPDKSRFAVSRLGLFEKRTLSDEETEKSRIMNQRALFREIADTEPNGKYPYISL